MAQAPAVEAFADTPRRGGTRNPGLNETSRPGVHGAGPYVLQRGLGWRHHSRLRQVVRPRERPRPRHETRAYLRGRSDAGLLFSVAPSCSRVGCREVPPAGVWRLLSAEETAATIDSIRGVRTGAPTSLDGLARTGRDGRRRVTARFDRLRSAAAPAICVTWIHVRCDVRRLVRRSGGVRACGLEIEQRLDRNERRACRDCCRIVATGSLSLTRHADTEVGRREWGRAPARCRGVDSPSRAD